MSGRNRALVPPLGWRDRCVRYGVIGVALIFLLTFLILPLVALLSEALAKGAGAYFASFGLSDMHSGLGLTLIVAAIAVPANMLFGIAAAWLVTKHEFSGKSLLVTLIDLPFSVSPVISGLIYVLLFGRQGLFGDWLSGH